MRPFRLACACPQASNLSLAGQSQQLLSNTNYRLSQEGGAVVSPGPMSWAFWLIGGVYFLLSFEDLLLTPSREVVSAENKEAVIVLSLLISK